MQFSEQGAPPVKSVLVQNVRGVLYAKVQPLLNPAMGWKSDSMTTAVFFSDIGPRIFGLRA